MADVVGMSDVSSPDTGKGSVLKTGGGRKKYNMKGKKPKGSASQRLIKCMEKAKTTGERRQCKVMYSIRSETTKQHGYRPSKGGAPFYKGDK